MRKNLPRDDPYFRQYQQECDATWEVREAGSNTFKIRCRSCGVVLLAGGTPKCLMEPQVGDVTPPS